MSAPTPTTAAGGVPAPSGGATGRLLARPAFWVVALTILFVLPVVRSFVRRLPPPPPVLSTLPAFEMTDQAGQTFGSRELLGKVWVADFVYTSCLAPCDALNQQMATIEQRARQLGPDLHLVSLAVDPARDTPERLAAYAARTRADPHKWSFLTAPAPAIQAVVTGGFKIGVAHAAIAGDLRDIVHGERLVLVDRHLRVRGYYEASAASIDQLLAELGRVANEGPGDEPPAPR